MKICRLLVVLFAGLRVTQDERSPQYGIQYLDYRCQFRHWLICHPRAGSGWPPTGCYRASARAAGEAKGSRTRARYARHRGHNEQGQPAINCGNAGIPRQLEYGHPQRWHVRIPRYCGLQQRCDRKKHTTNIIGTARCVEISLPALRRTRSKGLPAALVIVGSSAWWFPFARAL